MKQTIPLQTAIDIAKTVAEEVGKAEQPIHFEKDNNYWAGYIDGFVQSAERVVKFLSFLKSEEDVNDD